MLVRTQNQLLHTNLENLKNFSVQISPKFFDVMSSQLYSNPIKAVIREIVNNAVDAVKAVGKPLSSVTISAPTAITPFFIVQDQGPGLSPEEMELFYTRYFASSKDHTDDFIGGFGLGCKSPFALTDNFTVISCHGGMRRTYFLFRKEGIPAISLIAEEPCGNFTGLTVKVPISTSKFSDFCATLRDHFLWWPDLPTFTNIDVMSNVQKDHLLPIGTTHLYAPFISKLFSPDWPNTTATNNYTYYKSRTNIFVGNTLYTINPHPEYNHLCTVLLSIYNNFIIYTDISNVEFTPSREQLHYSAFTVSSIKSLLSKILDNLKENFLALYKGRLNFHDFVKACVSPNATIENNQHFKKTFYFFKDVAHHLQVHGIDLYSIRPTGLLSKDDAYAVPHFVNEYSSAVQTHVVRLALARPTIRPYAYSLHGKNKAVCLELAPSETINISPTDQVINKKFNPRSRHSWNNYFFESNKKLDFLVVDAAKMTETDVRTMRRYVDFQDNDNFTVIITANTHAYVGFHPTIRMATDDNIRFMLEIAPKPPARPPTIRRKVTIHEFLTNNAYTYDAYRNELVPYSLPHVTNFWVPFNFVYKKDPSSFTIPKPLHSWIVRNSPDIKDIAFVQEKYAGRSVLKQIVRYTPDHILKHPDYIKKLFCNFIYLNGDSEMFPITGSKLQDVKKMLRHFKESNPSVITNPDFKFMWEVLDTFSQNVDTSALYCAYNLFHSSPVWVDMEKNTRNVFSRFLSFLEANPIIVFMVLGSQNAIIDKQVMLDLLSEKADTFFNP